MKLSELIKDVPFKNKNEFIFETSFDRDPDISAICTRSQDVQPGNLFIAVKGFVADGHDYLQQAFKNGCVAAIAETESNLEKRIIPVQDSRKAMAVIASKFYGHPSEDMILIGVTGTNGKTTLTYILESILKTGGFNPGVIGTINIRYNGITHDNPVTTPDSVHLQATLAKMRDGGVTHVIMEVSSHGIALHRVDGCSFDIGIFTNLSQDHLDFHPDMGAYFECKKSFFTTLLSKTGRAAIINMDDPKGECIAEALSISTIGTSTRHPEMIFSQTIIDDITGLKGTILIDGQPMEIQSPLTGNFNLENILGATGAAFALDIPIDIIAQGINTCTVIPGRLEKVNNTADRYIFVDYAHTPDALESILETLKQRAPGKIITVFGCGGDRDKTKRPLMGKIAQSYSDIAIVTSDNPRSEHPDQIIRDILQGMSCHRPENEADQTELSTSCQCIVVPDRRSALQKAVSLSSPQDIIIAAGKGHETYQITNAGTIHFDDREELAQALKSLKTARPESDPIPFDLTDLQKAIGVEALISTLPLSHQFKGIGTDSRTIRSEECFVALKGDKFDGGTFVLKLLQKGIKGFITSKGFLSGLSKSDREYISSRSFILFEVDSPLKTLGMLARYQRLRAKAKVIAITGSNGKTTARQMSQNIFEQRFNTLATQGNLNNEIGLPMTLLRLSSEHEWAIVEMGMNHPGEISRLSQIAVPDIAVITTISKTHLEGLGSLENIALAKAEIFQHTNHLSTAILNADDPMVDVLNDKAKEYPQIERIIRFGVSKEADIKPTAFHCTDTHIEFELSDGFQSRPMSVETPAPFMMTNIMAACAIAMTAGIDLEAIHDGLEAFQPVTGRMNIQKISDHIHLIDDTYNASPASMTQALNTLKILCSRKHGVAVLGDMLELGESAEDLHEEIGKIAAGSGIEKLYIHGNHADAVMKGALSMGFKKENIFIGSKKDITQEILNQNQPDMWILVKGSRGMAMEEIITTLKQQLKGA